MKIKIILIINLFLFIHFSACKPKCNKYGGEINKTIPEKFRIKISSGDTLIYKTDTNKLDTLIVISTESKNSSEPGSGWYECIEGKRYWRNFEEYNVFLKNPDSLSKLNTVSVLQLYPASIMPVIHFAVNNDLYPIKNPVITKYILNDSIYKNVYTIQNDTIILHYNIQYLIIDYQINNTEKYYLNKYITNKN